MVDLGTLGGSYSAAAAVTDQGYVVGASTTTLYAPGPYHAFLWTPTDGMVALATLGGTYSYAVAVNDNGQAVGSSDTAGDAALHGVMWLLAPLDIASRLNRLIDQITAYSLERGLTAMLDVQLDAAIASWDGGNHRTAVNQLETFIRQVNAQRGKALMNAQADELVRIAQGNHTCHRQRERNLAVAETSCSCPAPAAYLDFWCDRIRATAPRPSLCHGPQM